MAFPLRKYFPMMHGSSIDEQDIAPDTILEGDIADDAVTTDKIIDDALSANPAGRAKIATDFFDVATVLDLFAAGALTEANLDVLIADNQFTLALLNNLMDSGVIADDRLVSSIVKEPGRMAMGLIDFNAEGDAASTVQIGDVTYLEATGPTVTNGEWENGGTANASATSLATAINGDTRASLVYAAVAVDSSVWVFALVVGTDGNVDITATGTEPDVVDNLIGGAVAAVKQTVHIQHTVTAEEATQVQVLIPLPFDAAFFEFHVYDSTGGILPTEVTDRGTVVNTGAGIPAYFQLLTQGATHISSGDIIRLTAQE